MLKLFVGLLIVAFAAVAVQAAEVQGESPQSLGQEAQVTIPLLIGLRHYDASYEHLDFDASIQTDDSWPWTYPIFYYELVPADPINVLASCYAGIEVFCTYANGWICRGQLDAEFASANKLMLWVGVNPIQGMEPEANCTVKEMATASRIISSNDVPYPGWTDLRIVDHTGSWETARMTFKTYGDENSEMNTLTYTIEGMP